MRTAKTRSRRTTPGRAGFVTRRVGASGQTSNRAGTEAALEPEALSVTHWFDAEQEGNPYATTVRFTGHRIGVRGKPGPRDAFVKDETVDGIVPGSGKVSITTWAYGLEPGEWAVTANLIRGSRPAAAGKPSGAHTLPRAAWSWRRWAVSTGQFAPVKTRWEPLARLTSMPAVIHGSWPALLAVGILVGVAVQATLLARANVSVGLTLIVDLVAGLAGLIGAKLLYVLQRPPGAPRQSIAEGLTVDGFLLAAPLVAAVALLALDVPIGLFLDATAPGLFFGVAIGRLGCFFTGCCAGRCTRSRWGMWSSNRRVGARRVPTQLLESAAGLLIAVVTTLVVLGYAPAVPGTIFVAAFAVYVIIRQFLLRQRAEPHNPIRARLTAAAAAVVLLVDAVVWLASGT